MNGTDFVEITISILDDDGKLRARNPALARMVQIEELVETER
jgi:hypothetical protein